MYCMDLNDVEMSQIMVWWSFGYVVYVANLKASYLKVAVDDATTIWFIIVFVPVRKLIKVGFLNEYYLI